MMHHYQCNTCNYTWYTTLETNRCADPTCLKYNIIDISPSQAHTFEYWSEDEIMADAETARSEGSRHMTEHITELIKHERETSNNDD